VSAHYCVPLKHNLKSKEEISAGQESLYIERDGGAACQLGSENF